MGLARGPWPSSHSGGAASPQTPPHTWGPAAAPPPDPPVKAFGPFIEPCIGWGWFGSRVQWFSGSVAQWSNGPMGECFNGQWPTSGFIRLELGGLMDPTRAALPPLDPLQEDRRHVERRSQQEVRALGVDDVQGL